MRLEAAILTGGASRRMGSDKASLMVDGLPMGRRIADVFLNSAVPTTVLGREPIEGAEFLRDEEDYAGPLVALSRFRPRAEAVMVVSCDLPRFDIRLVRLLEERLSRSNADAAVPVVDGYRQPLVSLYRVRAFGAIPEVLDARQSSMMAWLRRLSVEEIQEPDLEKAGLDRSHVAGVNTPEEFRKMIG